MKWIKPLVISLYVVMIAIDGYQVYRIAFVKHYADFPAYLAGAEGLRDGTNPYLPTPIPPYSGNDIRPFIYPLFLAWLFIPLTFLPPVVASFVWYFLSVAMMLYAINLCADLLRIAGKEKFLVFGIIGLFFMSVFQSDFMYGQIDTFVLFLLLLTAKYFLRNSERSAGYLAAAISAKFMPIVLLPMLLRMGVRAILIAVVTVGILCIGIPYLFAGSHIFHDYSYWFHTTILGDVQRGDNPILSFSLSGVIAQLFGLSYQPAFLKVACILFLICFPLWLIYKQKTLPALFLSFIVIPLTSSRSEPHHLVMLVPAVMLLAAMLLKRRIPWRDREIILTPQNVALGWLLLVAIQLMILWGYNAIIPFDTIGMLLIFGFVFRVGMSRNTLPFGGANELSSHRSALPEPPVQERKSA